MTTKAITIDIIQMKPKLGDIKENARKILELYNQSNSEIVLFPELCLTGYSPRDDLLSQKFIEHCHKELLKILHEIKERVCIISMPYSESGKLYNAVLALQSGQIIAKSFKTHLPNDEVFDEKRYFTKGSASFFEYNGVKFGLPICEDIWHDDVCMAMQKIGVEVLLVANASPFYIGKMAERLAIVKKQYLETKIPIIYCNQVLCQDGILYDGCSFCFDGDYVVYAKSFEEDTLNVTLQNGKLINSQKNYRQQIEHNQSNEMDLYNALIFGLKEYVNNAGFHNIVLGFSGGADSALVATLAVEAFGVENVKAVFMPSQFTSLESFEDAIRLAKNLGITMETIPIERPLKAFGEILKLSGIALENIQARIRGNILMAISNQTNSMLLTTGNKSEIAVGYCTIYGDMCGGYNPIKDLYKTQVFAMMKFINDTHIANIPERIITKEPSAELRENQKDSDSLPQYRILDQILIELIENRKIPEELTNFEINLVTKITKLIIKSEYKRLQSSLGTKISKQSFNIIEWRKNS